MVRPTVHVPECGFHLGRVYVSHINDLTRCPGTHAEKELEKRR